MDCLEQRSLFERLCFVTGQHSPITGQEFKIVHERCEDSLHGPKHGAEPQVEQHQEKQSGPEGAGWEKSHHLGEGYECQACPLHTLHMEKAEGTSYNRLKGC